MDHTKRKKTVSSELFTMVELIELEDGIEMKIRTEGIDQLPLRLEVCIPADSVIRNEHFWLEAKAGENMILRSGAAEIVSGGRVLELGQGFGEHEFKGHYSGEEINSDGYTIYCNAYTPVEKTVELRIKK